MTAPTSPSTPATFDALSFLRADELAPELLHATFTRAFADYLIGPFQIPVAQWPMFLARQGVDLALSRVAMDAAGAPLAFAFVAPRPLPRRWRLATMGATPEARGSGAAPALLDDLIARAAAASQHAVELEVFAQNERARRLYEGRGFRKIHDLLGYVADAGTIAPSAPGAGIGIGTGIGESAPRSVDMPQLLSWLEAAEHRIADLPLQVTATVIRHGVDYHGWQTADAQVVFSLPDETVMIHSLIAPRDTDARALIRALVAVYPERRLRVPQLQREDLGGAALRALGAVPQPLHQQLMLRPL